MSEIKSICVVCFANYCRSPVASELLKHKYSERGLEIISAGLAPKFTGGMDKRSIDFLKMKNIHPSLHTPRKVNKNILNDYDLILAMDTFILMELNKKYEEFGDKIRLFNFNNLKLKVFDPYTFSEKEYLKVMNTIYQAVEEIDL